MKNTTLLVSLALAFAATLSSCTTPIQVSASNPVAPIYEQGNPVLISKKKSEVRVRLLSDRFAGDISLLPEFVVVFANGSKSVVDFSTDNVTATSGGKAVRVYTYEKLQSRIRTQAAMLALAGSMAGAAQSMAASMPQTTYSSGTVNAYGTGGYATGTYTARTTTYNPAATAAAVSNINANTMNNMRNIAENRDAALQDTTSMLRRNTVMPAAVAGGVVKLYAQDIRRGLPLILTVNAAGESHEFHFDIGGSKSSNRKTSASSSLR